MARTDSATAVPALLAAGGLLRAEETWRGACPAWDLVVHTLRDSYPQPAPTPAALQARMEAVAGEEPVTEQARLRRGIQMVVNRLAVGGAARVWTLPELLGAMALHDAESTWYLAPEVQELLLRSLGGPLGDVPSYWALAFRRGERPSLEHIQVALEVPGGPAGWKGGDHLRGRSSGPGGASQGPSVASAPLPPSRSSALPYSNWWSNSRRRGAWSTFFLVLADCKSRIIFATV